MRSRSPGRSKVQLPSMSAPRRAVTLSDTGRHGERAHCRRYLKPIFGCLRRNRGRVFAAAFTRYLKPVYAAEPADIGDFPRLQILGA